MAEEGEGYKPNKKKTKGTRKGGPCLRKALLGFKRGEDFSLVERRELEKERKKKEGKSFSLNFLFLEVVSFSWHLLVLFF